ncbi:MAG: hypothetical protein WCK29_04265 [archaeon]
MMINKFNKKADLRENMVGIIIGILCLALIAGFAVMLYNIFIDSEVQNVKSTINSMGDKLDALKVDQEYDLTFQGFKGASNWFLFAWNRDDANIPDSCNYKSCICLCNVNGANSNGGTGGGLDPKTIQGYCHQNGYCKSFDTVRARVNTLYKIGDPEPRINLLETSMALVLTKGTDGVAINYTDPKNYPSQLAPSIP